MAARSLMGCSSLQRGGVGRALVTEARRLARDLGVDKLHVVANPDAVAFYRAVGFSDAGTTQTQFGPAPQMALRLTKARGETG
jgi:predicted N-acetyltransferase YhbS